MIRSFRNRLTETIAKGSPTKGFPSDLVRSAQRKLFMLDTAVTLSPPGNKLHALTQDRKGQHAIRINDQFRICFRWTDAGPEDVEIVDYH